LKAKNSFESDQPHALGSQGWGKGLLNHFDAAERDFAMKEDQ
jgi:hypothetical protein